jgi:hypothetical protein
MALLGIRDENRWISVRQVCGMKFGIAVNNPTRQSPMIVKIFQF